MLDAIFDNNMLALFVVITLGMLAGRIKLAGITLGSSATIFVALVMGYFGYQIPSGIGSLGLVLFVYCVGLDAGPSFFRAFFRRGRELFQLAAVLVVSGAAATWALYKVLGIPVDLAVGLFAGALTSTPGLAAAAEAVPESSQVAVGYGIAYPIGVIGVVVFVQLLPRLLRIDLDELGKELQAREDAGRQIVRVLVEVVNPAVVGKNLTELKVIAEANCQVSRMMKGDWLVPIPPNFRLASGQHLLVVGREFQVPLVVDYLGRRSAREGYVMDTENQRMQVVVSSKNVTGQSLAELEPLDRFGVTVTRIVRHDIEFVPRMSDVVEYGDSLNVVGEPESLHRFADFAGHRAEMLDETDIISIGIGIIAGIVLGTVSINLGEASFALGLAGGPLFVALILGHFGRVGPVVGHVPRASRMLMMQIGLALFLADAGANAGGELIPTLQQHGLALCAAAAVVNLLPLTLGYLFASRVLKIDLLSTLGGVCGGMTSTPGLGAITAKTVSRIPVISYAAAYPVALILMTIIAQALVGVMSL